MGFSSRGALTRGILSCPEADFGQTVLAIEDQAGASRLARVLLADPLAAEQEWEKALIDDKRRDEKAIMLRFAALFLGLITRVC